MEVVDCFDVEAFRFADVFEDLPVGAGRPGMWYQNNCGDRKRMVKELTSIETM